MQSYFGFIIGIYACYMGYRQQDLGILNLSPKARMFIRTYFRVTTGPLILAFITIAHLVIWLD